MLFLITVLVFIIKKVNASDMPKITKVTIEIYKNCWMKDIWAARGNQLLKIGRIE